MKLEDKVNLWWERFHCRRDLYGLQTAKFNPEKNKFRKYVSPVYIDKYKSAESRAGVEIEHPSEMYVPLSKEAVQEHIQGHREILIYMPKYQVNTTHFAAIDFDLQHGFHEVQNVSRLLTAHGVPHGIARSTSKGHHIYIFFDEEVKAYLITNFVNQMFKELAYYERMNADQRDEQGRLWTNPEVFPKVIEVRGAASTGYGIKPALNLKALENNRCCFVDINDEVIGGKGTSQDQWEHFANIPVFSAEKFVQLIKDLGIDIDKDMRLSESRGAVNGRYTMTEYVAPEDGDFMAVVNGCNALKRIWNSPQKDWPHDSRVAMVAFAMRCKGGLDILREKIGATEMTAFQMEHSKSTNQMPWTCKTLQIKGVCLVGRDPSKVSGNSLMQGEAVVDYCFEKAPPRDTIEGKVVINPDNLPEEEWVWPSPIRMRIPFKRMGLEGLKQEIAKLDKDDPELDTKLSELGRKVAALKDKKSRDSMYEYTKSRNLTLVKTLKHIFGEALQQKAEESHEGIAASTGYREINNKRFTRLSDWGYSNVKVGIDGEDVFFPISNFEIEFELDKKYFPTIGEPSRIFSGTIRCNGKINPFQIDSEDYSNNNKISAAIYNAIGPEADFKNSDLDLIRSAIYLFGCERTKSITTHENYGFDDATNPTMFRTKKGLVTADGFSDNEKEISVVDLSQEPGANKLALKEISKEELASTVDVIMTNYLNMQEPITTYTTLAHTLQAAIHNTYIPMPEAPCLYLDGTTGTGKSQVALMAQNFHGRFATPLSIKSTLGSINLSAMLFKDSLFLVDDYKLGARLETMLIDIIQKAYDRSERGRLRSDFKQGDVMINRSLMVFTGESLPTSEASVVARLIHVPFDRKLLNTKDEKENFNKVKKTAHLFPGVLAKFIQFMLQNYPKKTVVYDKFEEITDVLSNGLGGNIQNGPRIINNLSANFLTWTLFLEFLLLEDLITQQKFDEYHETHRKHIMFLREHLITKCTEEQASNIFLGIVKELFVSGGARIAGLSSSEDKGETIGFVDPDKKGVIYLIPQLSYKVASKTLRDAASELHHTRESVGKQLREDGFLVDYRSQSTTIQKRFRGTRQYVWALDAVKAGFGFVLADAENLQPESVPDDVSMPLSEM